ncbi:MAG: DsbA family protein [Nitrosomonas sp.]|nr:DsbA family protein [Nitrosomonas sp.]
MQGINQNKTLWYIADPMCSWCWGFAPTIDAVRQRYAECLTIAIILGGLRPGTKLPIANQQRQDILGHWHNVQRLTGQPFLFEGAMPEGFIYDTEPACRGVVTVSTLAPSLTFAFFTAIQQAFYTKQIDVTQPINLMQIAANLNIDTEQFMQAFSSEAIKQKTLANFGKAKQWGINGFPSLVLQNHENYQLLSSGYCPAETLYPQIDKLIEST